MRPNLMCISEGVPWSTHSVFANYFARRNLVGHKQWLSHTAWDSPSQVSACVPDFQVAIMLFSLCYFWGQHFKAFTSGVYNLQPIGCMSRDVQPPAHGLYKQGCTTSSPWAIWAGVDNPAHRMYEQARTTPSPWAVWGWQDHSAKATSLIPVNITSLTIWSSSRHHNWQWVN